ncbi:MAG: hypothetical protein OET44_00280 [Gammaproteobacteria bacterium]|nr:hypothetical protein [Gammaproteobacteria bacterium]
MLIVLLAGCTGMRDAQQFAAPAHAYGNEQKIAELSAAITALGDRVDPAEALQAAEVAVRYPLKLAEQYELTTPPLWHNTLVNLGIKPRGLCVDWTRDLLVRLRELRLSTLKTHWGVANSEAAFLIEHSTAIITVRGESMETGIVLDPWRNSGRLFWSRISEDTKYQWHPLAEVQAKRRLKQAARAEFTSSR